MKAAVLEDIKKITIRDDVPEPTLGPSDVLVRAKACGICGTDVHIWEGDFFPTFPLVPGHELAGEVVKVGSAVEDLKPGDRVMVDPTVTCEECHFCMINRQNHCLRWNAVGVTRDGGFGEYVRVPAKNCYRFQNVTFGQAAFCEPLACVVFGQDRARIDIGSEVLILGAGPIGQLHLQASRANGAAAITVTDVVESKLDLAREHGAQEIVIADNALEGRLKKIAPYGFDVVIDCTGIAPVMQNSIKYVKNGGKYLVFGVCGPHDKIEISPFEIYRRDIEIIGSFAIRRTYDRAFKLMEHGVVKVDKLIHEAMPVEELPRGLDMMKRGAAAMKLQIVWP
ncbi:zinc-dependent alcohol dehydrogenase family protein [Polyangium aurulentum]|uniref:zinc-dependent alcohol dehydrogenase family protein n=1 Tax=Polyangium aurulentum TaxID=2567896 RepID=UPI0010ADF3A5|nr:zinc-dependent alcohol dehydrogenase family protein [Polyangium aurulentum]UQA62083.1 zinc-dependent alcohol dehydrogenase family protein [Polyangium aurulentum]